MKTSEQLLRRLKRQVLGVVGVLVLIVLWEWFKSPSTNNGLFEVLGAVFCILGFWLIDCTEIILAAIKEEAGVHK